MMDLFAKCYETFIQDEIRDMGLYPYFHALESRQDVTVTMEGARRIMLGSNNYLGLTVEPAVIEAGIAALRQYGTGCSGSRFLNGTLQLHLELEAELADFLHQDAAMTFSTGFQSNLGAISAIAGHGDYILCDKENHASIYDGCKLSFARMYTFKHNDMQDLERLLAAYSPKGGILIVTDGVFSMTGEIGLVKIFTCQKFHDGVRLEMLCGRKAYRYVNSILEQNKRISGLLSAKPQQTAQAAERMLDELAQVKYRAGALELRLIAQAAEALAGKGDSLLFMELSADGLRQMADAGMRGVHRQRRGGLALRHRSRGRGSARVFQAHERRAARARRR